VAIVFIVIKPFDTFYFAILRYTPDGALRTSGGEDGRVNGRRNQKKV
jgi:hypothetical protein